MTKTRFTSVDEYLAAQPDAARGLLQGVRSASRKALPEAEEGISYQIPTYKVPGRAVVYFAGWKQHYSLYPAGDRIVTELREELAPFEIEKGTIRFPFTGTVPVKLIERVAKLRAEEVAAKKR